MIYSERELAVPVAVEFIRGRGYCAKGTRNYWAALGLDFRKLIRGNFTVADLVQYETDPFVAKLITEVLKEYHGR